MHKNQQKYSPNIFIKVTSVLLIMASLSANAISIRADTEQKQLIQKGEYIAQAADCIACHKGAKEHDDPFVGGYVIESPIGDIVGSNITPSKAYGIGNHSEADFKRALTEGVALGGKSLYPAMPYTSYRGLTDEDIHALYTYFMEAVKPVDRKAPETKLAFPYSMRYVVKTAGVMFLQDLPSLKTDLGSAELNRGGYLADVLGHCSMCHSPRNLFMAEENNNSYFSGSPVGPWYAPNITSDAISGVGGWTQPELVQYLRTGNVKGKSQAASGMAEAIENSLRFLTDEDLNALAAYMLQVPDINNSTLNKASYEYGGVPNAEGQKIASGDLYISSCATCHGVDGEGSKDGYFPSLKYNSAVGSEHPHNLIMVVLEGVKRQRAHNQVNMPAFGKDLDDQEIATVVNYVSKNFGNGKMQVTPADIATARAGGEPPTIVKLTPYLVWGGTLFGVLLLLGFTLFMRRRKK